MKLMISAIIPASATQRISRKVYSAMRENGVDVVEDFLYKVYTPWTTKAADSDYELTSFLIHRNCECIKDCIIRTGELILTQHLNVKVESTIDIQSDDEIYACVKQFKKQVFGRTFRRVLIDESDFPDIDSKSLPPFKLSKSIRACKKFEVKTFK